MTPVDTYIIFELNDAAFAVRSTHVRHVEMLEHVTPVPNTAAAVDGVVFSRGQVFPALNLRARFGLPRVPHAAATRLIFLQVQERVVALIVDRAREFERIPSGEVRPVEATLVGVEGNYVEGVATVKGRSVLILDVGKVLTLEETTVPAGAETLAAPVQS